MYYTYEHQILAPETRYFVFTKRVTSNFYSEANTRILSSVNNCLQDVLELTPIIDLMTLFCILNILFELSSTPKNSIPIRKSDWNFKKSILHVINGLIISFRDLIIKGTLLSLLASDCTWVFHFNFSVI